ncbi:MAG: hypothetical protein AAB885_02225 [Patescibacteria group bacterium]
MKIFLSPQKDNKTGDQKIPEVFGAKNKKPIKKPGLTGKAVKELEKRKIKRHLKMIVKYNYRLTKGRSPINLARLIDSASFRWCLAQTLV